MRCSGRIRDIVAFSCVGAAFLLAATHAARNLSFGDEWLYVYDASLVAQGMFPYRDFFFAHPPAHLLLLTLVYLIAGKTLFIYRLVPIIITLFSGLLVYRITRRVTGVLPALFACGIFLFSPSILPFSAHSAGWDELVFFLLLALECFLAESFFVSGIFLGIAVLTNFLGGVCAAILFLVSLFRRNTTTTLRLLEGALVVAFPIVSILFLLTGNAFIEQSILYQFLKPSVGFAGFSKSSVLEIILKGNAALLLLTGFPCLFLLWSNGEERGQRELFLVLLLFGAYLSTFLILPQPFTFYFLAVVPFAAIGIGYSVERILERHRRAGKNMQFVFTAIGATIVILTLRSSVGTAFRFEREYGSPYIAFNEIYRIAADVNLHISINAPIHGDFAVTPLIALLSGRRISANEADMSPQRFTSGISDLSAVLAHIEADPPGGIALSHASALYFYLPYQTYVEAHYSILGVYTSSDGPPVSLFVRKKEGN